MINNQWRKSTYSSTSNCLEVSRSSVVHVRDSKMSSSTGSVVSFHPMSWEGFIQDVVRTKLS